MPRWMFETRTDAWHAAGLGEEIERSGTGRAAFLRALLYALLIAGVLIAFGQRQDIAPGYGTAARIVTVVALGVFGWGLASSLGSGLVPRVLRRMDPGTAGTVGFVIRLLTIAVIVIMALRVAGLKAETLAVGGAFTAVILGLAAQQTIGNLFAGIVLQGTRPFRVGERVRLTGGAMAGSVEGTVSSLGLFYTSFVNGADRMSIPNSVLLQLAVVPLREPQGIDMRARFDSAISPAQIQRELEEAITVPTRRPPSIWLEEVDRDEVILRITATPQRPSDGAKLAEEILTVTRAGGGSQNGDGEYPVGHA